MRPQVAAPRPSRTARYLAVAAAAALVVVIGITWVMVRRWQSAAMVERSLPEIERLAGAGQYVDAYRLGQRAAAVAPGDARVQRALGAATAPLTMNEPVGADVYFKDYNDVDGPWLLVGRVPITGARVPQGELRWRLVKDGFDTAEGASAIGPVITLRRTGEAPAGMVYVRGGRTSDQTTDGPVAGLLDGPLRSHESRIQAIRRCGRLPRPEILGGFVRCRRALPRQDRPARPGNVGTGHVPRRTGRLSRRRSQLVRGRGIRRVRQ